MCKWVRCSLVCSFSIHINDMGVFRVSPSAFEDGGLGFSGSLVSQLCHKMGHKFVVILVCLSHV